VAAGRGGAGGGGGGPAVDAHAGHAAEAAVAAGAAVVGRGLRVDAGRRLAGAVGEGLRGVGGGGADASPQGADGAGLGGAVGDDEALDAGGPHRVAHGCGVGAVRVGDARRAPIGAAVLAAGAQRVEVEGVGAGDEAGDGAEGGAGD